MSKNKQKKTKKTVDPAFNAEEHLTHKKPTVDTALMTKEHEPMIVRKYTQMGFPLYVSLICGANLDDLDVVVKQFRKEHKELIKSDSIQDKRTFCGLLTEALVEHYGDKTEGVAVCWYVDKMWVSSLFGDFMNHAPCKAELYSILSIMPHV